MTTDRTILGTLGNDMPILADGHRAPDRREISLRWLSGTFLTGITSCVLMGVALFAALDGRQQLAIPAEAFAITRDDTATEADVTRGARLLSPAIAARPTDKAILEVPTIIKDGEREVVRRQPFSHVTMALAAAYNAPEDYPPFDPLSIFAANESSAVASRTGTLYDSDVESEVALKTIPFPVRDNKFPFAGSMSLDEVEENVRSNGSVLTDGNTQVAALYYIDPRRFDGSDNALDISVGPSARIVEENLTVSMPEAEDASKPEYADDLIPIRRPQTISAALKNAGYPDTQAQEAEKLLSEQLASADLEEGDLLRMGLMQTKDMARIVRMSIYRGGKHILTMATNDRGRMVQGEEPQRIDAVDSAFDDTKAPIVSNRELPRIYDGIYRAALSYGMTTDMTALVIKLLAANVDFQAQLKPTDSLEAFFSVADESGKATENSELLYVRARFGDTITTFYRFQNPDDGSVDYYDENGKSIRQFLLRNPVPNGRLSSGFGMRRHPILGYSRMHSGTDWAAPVGTPIIATGNGVVEKAGWSSGYGNQTIIRHANGYETSYNHQSGRAKGIVPGAKITQGQVIGYVGSTGSSTGAHLHYELIVNGTKVNAMKVRLPGGKSLNGDALAQFEIERSRIDTLLGKSTDVASAK
ncbi:M23 family metallopeptidase [Agrobacterium sp. ES01]|uniref:M23 family metallopeptidase n=1 Tax=Agrobacterium sp. ES01 TaxID=3420714 RepID=UPI003D0C868E